MDDGCRRRRTRGAGNFLIARERGAVEGAGRTQNEESTCDPSGLLRCDLHAHELCHNAACIERTTM